MSANMDRKKGIKRKVEQSSDDNLNNKGNGILKEISKDDEKEIKPKRKMKKDICKGDENESKPKRKMRKDSSDDEHIPKKVKKRTRSQDNELLQPTWEDYELLQEQNDLNTYVAKNIIKLFEESNTIPFIARYRRHITGNMSPEDLRYVKDSYDKIQALKAKTQTVLRTVEKTGQLDEKLRKSILGARNLEALDHIYAPYKPGGKRTLAERAKAHGLEKPALTLLENSNHVDLFNFVKPSVPELNTLKLVEKGIEHILAHAIATNADMLTFLHKLKPEVNFLLETKKAQKRESKTKVEKDKKSDNKEVDESKFANFFDYKIPVKYVKPHQILAINRGEHLKFLSVKIVVPEYVFHKFNYFCNKTWTHRGPNNDNRNKLMQNAIQDSYTRLVEPLIIREIRAELKSKAEKASIDVFNGNLKQLLMANPLKGRSILGVDPGYQHGCKLALISDTGSVLASEVVYPHKNNNRERDEHVITSILKEFNCSLIALGNGTACRETESWISDMIGRRSFYPLDVTYTIVSENGASIYSCSPEAKKEFPKMDPNLISAVSLARRIQEPLAELVKIEPKHLGVGMYQHDLPKKQLEQALEDVVSECVSFVGVDLNTASQCLLRRIAGLSDKKASEIITYRENNGPFVTRKELLKVKGIGSAIFLQAAGFLRVGPITLQDAQDFYENESTTKLDCTIIHPESYKITKQLIKLFKLNPSNIGEETFMQTIKNNTLNLNNLSDKLETTEENIKLILDALSKPLNHDLRNECDIKPLFKKGLTNMSELEIGAKLTGRVDNVTHFGCFLDIGVGCNGLIHTSRLNGNVLQIGDRVEVEVVEVDLQRKRISLQYLRRI